jgi:hypothetical protein
MKPSTPSDNHDRRVEQIVAYLDGELSPTEASLVERQMADDAEFRSEVQGIEQAWSALDALPLTVVDDRFSQTTMEMVVVAARTELAEKTQAFPIKRRNNLLGKILLTAAAASLAFLTVRLFRDNPNQILLADLPTIQYLDIYSQFRDVDFLRDLDKAVDDNLWNSDLSTTDFDAAVTEFQTIANNDQRRDWLAQLDDEDRAALRAKYNRFLAMSPAEQDRLRQLNAAVTSDSQVDQLRDTMLRYQAWLGALPASQQFELRELSNHDRVQRIASQLRRDAMNPWIQLSPEEARRLEHALADVREQLFRELPPRPSGEARGEPRTEGRGEGRGDGRSEGRGQGQGNRERNQNLAQQIRRQFLEHHEEWLPQILAALSPEHREQFEQLAPGQQQRQIVRWIMENRNRPDARRGGRPFSEVSQQELERYFVEETDAATKERLLAQPRERMEQQLRRMYFQGEFPDETFQRGDGQRGDGPRGERPPGFPPRGEGEGFGRRRGPGPGFGPMGPPGFGQSLDGPPPGGPRRGPPDHPPPPREEELPLEKEL